MFFALCADSLRFRLIRDIIDTVRLVKRLIRTSYSQKIEKEAYTKPNCWTATFLGPSISRFINIFVTAVIAKMTLYVRLFIRSQIADV